METLESYAAQYESRLTPDEHDKYYVVRRAIFVYFSWMNAHSFEPDTDPRAQAAAFMNCDEELQGEILQGYDLVMNVIFKKER